MKILALDTAAQTCSVAIIEDGSVLAELTKLNRRTHSRHIIGLIDTVCSLSDLEIGDVDGFAVTIGPGSFTGLRIGLSTIKGLAFPLNKPVVGVSSLDALAWQCAQSAYPICALLDARKKEVYYCHYRFINNKLMKEGHEKLGAPVSAVDGIREPFIFVGNAALLYQRKISAELGKFAYFAPQGQHAIRASSVGYLSLTESYKQRTIDAGLLMPKYIRKPDAELKFRGENR